MVGGGNYIGGHLIAAELAIGPRSIDAERMRRKIEAGWGMMKRAKVRQSVKRRRFKEARRKRQ